MEVEAAVHVGAVYNLLALSDNAGLSVDARETYRMLYTVCVEIGGRVFRSSPPGHQVELKSFGLPKVIRDPSRSGLRGNAMFYSKEFKRSFGTVQDAVLASTFHDNNTFRSDSNILRAIQLLYSTAAEDVRFNRVTSALIIIFNDEWSAAEPTAQRFPIPSTILQLAMKSVLFESKFLDPAHHDSKRLFSEKDYVGIAWVLLQKPKWKNDVTDHEGVRQLELIRYHKEGGSVDANSVAIWLARLYMVLVLGLSIGTAVFNWGKREALLEKIFDALQVASFMLISVFGLVKLQSEDPSVIRHTVFGIKILRDVDDVLKFTKCDDESTLKSVIMASSIMQPWLDPDGACYAVKGARGSIKLSRGITTAEIYAAGFCVDCTRVVSHHRREGYRLHRNDDGSAHIDIANVRLPYPSLTAPIDAHIIAGTE